MALLTKLGSEIQLDSDPLLSLAMTKILFPLMGVEMEDDHLNLANTDKSHELGDQQHLKNHIFNKSSKMYH